MLLASGGGVEIFYASKEVAAVCSDERRARRDLGANGAKKLAARLSDLASAATVTELVAGHPHPLSDDLSGAFALSLDAGRRLVFRPMEPIPVNDDGSVAWARVTSVNIVYIGDYHD